MPIKFNKLGGLPASGPSPHQFSASGQGTHSEGFVVEFTADSESWTGNFQRGLTSFDDVVEHPNHKDALVIAGGEVYVVNPFTKLLTETFGGTVIGTFFIRDKGLLILNNNFTLVAFNEYGQLWKTIRLTMDGIKNLKYEKNLILGEGLALHDEWFQFQIEVDHGRVLNEEKLFENLPFERQ